MADRPRVVVTGASSGIGASVVRHLVERGTDVVAAARRAGRLQDLADALADAPGRIVIRRTDVTSDADVRSLMATASEVFGGIDALVNNAGCERQADIEHLSDDDLDQMLRVNFIAAFHCIRAALPALRETAGMVINIGSTVVTRPPRGRFGYVATKGALEAMSRALAVDLGSDGVRVNVIRPGLIPSELRGRSERSERAMLADGGAFEQQALVTAGEGSDIAAAIEWLIGPGGRWVTGAVLDVDGGYSLGLTNR